ncbi:RNA-guided endonuclease InsQ/TnpB family protein [Candidatus Magnetominusculus dajiuhuensis]|uniref:RNA-guided endonuclease InsQ/TnpB family protein n=1 Tax=Candidatus Magnetominusculus dajiuhuensis TaxID=3137712 RepID=UPI003B429178
MRKTFIYKAKINKTTEANCLQWLELCRILYNIALSIRVFVYKQYRKTISMYDQLYQLPELKTEHPEFKAVGSQVLQEVLERLDKAYKSFFQRVKSGKGKAGFPRFKGFGRYDSFTLKQAGWKLDGRYLYIRNIGRFKLFLSRPIEGEIKTITVRRKSTGWFVAFSCDNVPVKQYPETSKEVGIDVGIKSFLVDSEGNAVANPKYYRHGQKILRRRSRSLSRKKKGSHRRQKARVLVVKAHEKVANQRKDFLHKVANLYISLYAVICVEDLKIKNMIRNRHLSKSISDSAWGMFFEMLVAKAVEAGRQIIKVDPKGTSQLCSNCGEKVPKSLSVRMHKCPHCHIVLDRDENAAINILKGGQPFCTSTYTIR